MSRATLVGLPGVGKSATAECLAHHWGCESWDTDIEIARRTGLSVADVLKNRGEAEFRHLEVEVLRDILRYDGVVATGGGIVTTTAGRELLCGETTLWLDCPDEFIMTRLGEGERPLLGDDWLNALGRLRRQREDWYREVATTRIDASGSVDVVVARIAAWFEARVS